MISPDKPVVANTSLGGQMHTVTIELYEICLSIAGNGALQV
jgi:aminopeptidase-like protein